MDLEIRTIAPEEFEAFFRLLELSFSHQPSPQELETLRRVTEFDRSLVAVDDGRFIGTAGAASLTLSVPGGELPMAGVTAVGVAPSHRRRGVLTSMMRRQLADIRDRGEAIAGLWASEGAIYWRFGYGSATRNCWFEIDTHRATFTRPVQPSGRVEFLERAEALRAFPPIFDRVRPGRPGMWARSPDWWEEIYSDLEDRRHGAGPLFFVRYRGTEGEDGYAAYRVKRAWSEDGPAHQLTVHELMAVSPQAYAELWRFLLGVDLVITVSAWGRPIDEPLFHMLAEPRRLGLRIGDGLWIRILDVGRALAGRRYSNEGRLVFEVRDPFCPWVEGRYELEGGSEGAQCRPTGRSADLVLEAADLGAAFLGGTGFGTLHRAGRVMEERPGAVGRADRMFWWDPPPWCAGVF